MNHFPQQPGPQHDGLGFFACTKALMNLPSTSGAMASTSIPIGLKLCDTRPEQLVVPGPTGCSMEACN